MHAFDVLAEGQRAVAVPTKTQRQHLDLLAALLDDDSAAGLPPEITRTVSDTETETDAETETETDTDAGGARILRPKFQRKHVPFIVGGVVLLSGASVGIAAALGAFEEPTDRQFSHCYTDASLDAAHNDFTVATLSGNPGDAAALAIDICRRDWENGRLQRGATTIGEPDGRTHPIPSLVACVLESGQVGVFPGNDATCRNLGLPIAKI